MARAVECGIIPAVQDNAYSLSSAIHRYLDFLEAEGCLPNTLRTYRHSLRVVGGLLPSDVRKFDKRGIRQLKAELGRRRRRDGTLLSVTTKNHCLIAIRGLLRYLIQEEDQDVLPPDQIRLFRPADRQLKVLRIEEIERLLAAPDVATKTGVRDRAILELFFSTGMRLSELASLNRRDVNLTTREMSIRGKRSKVRVVFISRRAAGALEQYLAARVDYLVPLFVAHPDRLARVVRGCDLSDVTGPAFCSPLLLGATPAERLFFFVDACCFFLPMVSFSAAPVTPMGILYQTAGQLERPRTGHFVYVMMHPFRRLKRRTYLSYFNLIRTPLAISYPYFSHGGSSHGRNQL